MALVSSQSRIVPRRGNIVQRWPDRRPASSLAVTVRSQRSLRSRGERRGPHGGASPRACESKAVEGRGRARPRSPSRATSCRWDGRVLGMRGLRQGSRSPPRHARGLFRWMAWFDSRFCVKPLTLTSPCERPGWALGCSDARRCRRRSIGWGAIEWPPRLTAAQASRELLRSTARGRAARPRTPVPGRREPSQARSGVPRPGA